MAWAQSSISVSPWRSARPTNASISHGRPAKCTGSSAAVRGVIAAATAAGSRFIVSGSTSASTGVAPVCKIALTVAQNVIGVVITSSPGPTPESTNARCSPAVQELSPTARPASRPL